MVVPDLLGTVSAEQLHLLRTSDGGVTLREGLAAVMGLEEASPHRMAIEVDLYMSAVRFAKFQHLTDDKLSALLGLTRAVHHKAVQESQALEKSFEHMNTLLLRHSVHRPPWSAAVFSFADMKAISTWFTQTYFTHYKLYQYAFTPRVLLNIKTHTAATLIETAPALPPLASAITEEVHSSQVDAARAIQEAQAEAEATKAKEEEEAATEEEINKDYADALPADIRAQVERIVEKEMGYLRTTVERDYKDEAQKLRTEIVALQGRLGK